jgi:transposase-like protein
VLRKEELAEGDVLREAVHRFVHALMEAEVTALVGAAPFERTEERTTQRNGHRSRRWDTRVGTLDLAIPKLRTGSYFPSWLEPRRRSERALVAVVAEAYVKGVSTRKVEALVQSLGIAGMSKSEVSRLCASLDEEVRAFRERRLDADYPYVWLDARYEHVRDGGRVVSMAVVGADALRADGVREVLGVDVGVSEDLVLRREFLQGLVGRGLRGAQLVVSDAHRGLKEAIAQVLVGAARRRCRVHFLRNVEARVPKTAQPMVGAAVRTIFQQPSRAAAQAQLKSVCATLGERFPAVVQLRADAEEEVLTVYDFPEAHWRWVYSTNPDERLNKELKRRSAAVGIFPNKDAVIRLFGAVLAEQNDEWLISTHYVSAESMQALPAQGRTRITQPGGASGVAGEESSGGRSTPLDSPYPPGEHGGAG